MSKKDLSLKKYDISRNRYRELKYFCLQYDEWTRQLSILTTIKPQRLTGMPSGRNGISDPTADVAAKCAELTAKCALIEQTAKEAAPEIHQWLLKSVTKDISYERLYIKQKMPDASVKYEPVPCCRQAFFAYRRNFFFLLAQKK